LADTERLGRHRHADQERLALPARRHTARLATMIAAVGIAAVVLLTFAVHVADRPHKAPPVAQQTGHAALPTNPDSYIGVYPNGVPNSYSGVTAFTGTTGVKPSVVLYYSAWLEPFKAAFASSAAKHGAIPLVQINPYVNLAAIARGQYDSYLSSYAEAVRAYGHPVILSIGHEMNGYWYPWGYLHTSPAVFVAAWRHVVNVFRSLGARNVTWMWTVNTIHKRANVPSPARWWPGSSYVNWVGIDGYYNNPSLIFASLFGPTIAAVRGLTHDPILIAETAVSPNAGQSEKITDLFAGVHLYGLLGFVWFDANRVEDWRLISATALTAFRRSAEKYYRPAQ
jgi:mannan endo-1,4-beta-mannosidase